MEITARAVSAPLVGRVVRLALLGLALTLIVAFTRRRQRRTAA